MGSFCAALWFSRACELCVVVVVVVVVVRGGVLGWKSRRGRIGFEDSRDE